MATKRAALKSAAKKPGTGNYPRTAFKQDGTPRKKPGREPKKPTPRYAYEPGTLFEDKPRKKKSLSVQAKAKLTFSRLTQEQRRELADASGISPLQYLMSVIREDSALPTNMKIYAAGIAAPYMHCRMPLAPPPKPENPDERNTDELRSQLVDRLNKLGKQTTRPAAEQSKAKRK